MEGEMGSEIFTYEGRLASFQKSKKRGSIANGRSKTWNWPHKSIAPEDLAKAGFYFEPSSENPDNVICFICHKNMDGWEAGDDPLLEHLGHAGECGWAILSAVEAEVQDFATQDPSSPEMMNARKVTFGGRWPHEGKRAWKCKTKQLVEAGWKYTPSLDSDDMATCAYCQLSLDGWEQNDKPWDEHISRAPNCPFFTLYEQYGPPKKKTAARSKASKASRLSNQSIAASETTMADMTTTTAGVDDTVLTTTSTTAQSSKKGRARSGTASRTKKTKSKKEEEIEIQEVPQEQPVVSTTRVEDNPTSEVVPEATEAIQPEGTVETKSLSRAPMATSKAKRGKKRSSEAADESTTTAPQLPVAKRRNTRNREESVDTFMTAQEDTQMTIEPPPLPSKRKASGTRKASETRKTSGTRKTHASQAASANTKDPAVSRISSVSVASVVAPMEEFPDDDEIERQLQADLDQLSDDEVRADSDSERRRSEGKQSMESADLAVPRSTKGSNHAMFDPTPMEVDNAEIEDEFQRLEAEMKVDEPQGQLVIPKKGRKASARKPSKQVKGSKKKPPPSPPVEEAVQKPEPELEKVSASNLGLGEDDAISGPRDVLEEQDDSIGSTDTVVKKIVTESDVESEQAQRSSGRPSKVSSSSGEAEKVLEPAQGPKKPAKRGRPSKLTTTTQEAELASQTAEVNKPAKRSRGRPSKTSAEPRAMAESAEPVRPADQEQRDQPPKRGRGRPPKASITSQSSADVEMSRATEGLMKHVQGRTVKKSIEVPNTKGWKGLQMPGAFREDTVEPTEESAHEFAPEQREDEEKQGYIDDDDAGSDELAQDFPMPPPKAPARQVAAPNPATPGKFSSPAVIKQGVLSPSQSPQSSDAENQPPSSVPASSATERRVPLAPRTVTPTQSSPSKRNVVAGLRSIVPWSAIDLDTVFGTPKSLADKENGIEGLLRKGNELASPEKRMTVEEWVQFNSSQAEKALKYECEVMVTKFESEGTRAMRVLEGLEVSE